MIGQFGANTALLVIDAQKGINALEHWGGPTGRRNNPGAEGHIHTLVDAFRRKGLTVIYTAHNSRQAVSPLKLGTPGGEFLDGIAPRADELVITKDVNSAFVGTTLELELRRRGIHRLVQVGYFTNFCVETTVRMAGNMGYDNYLIPDACATSNRIGFDGVDYDAELVHNLAVASLHGEFATALEMSDALGLLDGDAPALVRKQGNE
ncbi:cysteine hydrolase family protein [Novosphingobium sp.]|uniref:cysteine hydrolase family protein n=1 Tax=Novosphingobium sp. TaxID=1874826 RepID=UPI003B528610